jgi:hypothetical protein
MVLVEILVRLDFRHGKNSIDDRPLIEIPWFFAIAFLPIRYVYIILCLL